MKHYTLAFLVFFVLGLFNSEAQAEDLFEIEEFSLLSINSAITPGTLDYLKHNFKNIPAKSLIIIKLNTPGGLVTTTKDIITLIGQQDRPVVIWITPSGASASSAGAIIASAAHFVFMSPGSNMGAATPVGIGEDIKESDGKNKALSDLSALVRSQSQLRGRPSAPYENMILKATSFTDQEALKEKIIDGIASTQAELIKKISGRSFKLKGKEYKILIAPQATAVTYKLSFGQEILEVLANPQTAYFLFLIGVALIYFEFQAPGGYVMGGIGVTFVTLAAISFQVLPLNWGALGLMLIGVILMVIEIYVTSYAVLGLTGLGSFIMGSLFLFHNDEGFISIQYPVLISTLAGVLVASGIVVWFLLKDKNKHKKNDSFFAPLGSTGRVLISASDKYQVKVRGEIWNATSQDKLSVGDKIIVKSVNEQKLILNIQKEEESL